jgi:predicted Zn finger-like uncharacterized protein
VIVSCESCKSRYKLDDSKITGRGAKITCPKCKHVFVVLAPPPAVTEAPRPAMQPQPAVEGGWSDDEPTRVGRAAAEAARAAVESAAAAAVAPPEHEVVRPRASAAPAAAPTREEITARAAALDFRKVGVSAWKVKVRIGLVYDFSDIKTLRKYIQDGRVTPADVISHDGKTWKPIGEIPDLDVFFIEAYDKLAEEFATRPAPSRTDKPAPADLGNVAAELAAAAAAELDAGGPPSGPTYHDPFEAMKKRRKERVSARPPPKAAPGSSSALPIGAGAVVVLLLLVGGWWMFGRTPPAAPTPPPASAPTRERATTKAPDREWVPVAPPSVDAAADPGGVTVARPDDCPEGFEYLAAVKGCVARRGPPGPAGATGAAPAAAAAVGPGVPPAKSEQAVREETPEQVGDSAMKTQNYETAVTAYGKAVAAGSSTAVIKLGEAQMRLGDLPAAQATLTRAAASNKRAYKLLGELMEKNGDVAGARSAYTQYCAAFPKDTATKAHLDALGG